MTTLVFGHLSPDTDSTASPIVWAWYLSETGTPAEPTLLGEPNTEALYMLDRWSLDRPRVIADVEAGQKVVIVDTNNPAELPPSIGKAEIVQIVDHHKLTGGLTTLQPADVTIRPLACTCTIMADMMGADMLARAPEGVRGAMLTAILSDTLEFRSPTTTPRDREVAVSLADGLGVGIPDLAAAMFAAKSDVSRFSDAELVRMDSKKHAVGDTTFRVSVLETTAPEVVLARKASLLEALGTVAAEDGVHQVLFFVVDILREEATLLVPNALVRSVAEKSFGVTVDGDAVVLPGVMSRKKQIIPALAL